MSSGVVVIVRHGATTWSLDGRHTGITELALTPAGEARAISLRSVLADFDFATVLTSPRRRARRTAELAGFPDAVVEDRLAEWDYGAYEGMTREQIQLLRPGWTIWTGTPPAGESASEVTARAERLIEQVIPEVRDGRNVILFGHGHFSRALMVTWAGLPITSGVGFTLDPATISILGLYREDRVVHAWNSPAVWTASPHPPPARSDSTQVTSPHSRQQTAEATSST